MKNIKNIIEQKYPPENPNDLWMKDGKLYKSTSKGWVLIENQVEFTNSEQMSKSEATSGTIGVNKETGESSIYNEVTKQWNPLGVSGGGGGLTETTWLELKDKRDNSELVPGSLYRITDYQCTTTQENTRSAGHQFDIVLLALSENKLAEEGWAMMHDNIYDVTFADNVTLKCYLYISSYDDEETWYYNIVRVDNLIGYGDVINSDVEINEETKTATVGYTSGESTHIGLTYNYFQNSNLSAWKVWYCLDNDRNRFQWADDNGNEDTGKKESVTIETTEGVEKTYYSLKYYPEVILPSFIEIEGTLYYVFLNDEEELPFCLFTSKTPKIDDGVYFPFFDDQLERIGKVIAYQPEHLWYKGRGVIYRLIDEWNNDYPCDFKNMQMLMSVDGEGNLDPLGDMSGRTIYCYAFSDKTSGTVEDLSLKGQAISVKVKPRLVSEISSAMYFSPATLLYTNHNNEDRCLFGNINVGESLGVIITNESWRINIGDSCSVVILDGCSDVSIGHNNNYFGLHNVKNSTFGNNCQNVYIDDAENLNYGNGGVELATKEDLQ